MRGCKTELQKAVEGILEKSHNQTIFKSFLEEIFHDESDPERNHVKADDLMVQALETEGYDCSAFKKSATWRA